VVFLVLWTVHCLIGYVDPRAVINPDGRGTFYFEAFVLPLVVPPSVVKGLVGLNVQAVDRRGVVDIERDLFDVSVSSVRGIYPDGKRYGV
jgi:hypothetical protein